MTRIDGTEVLDLLRTMRRVGAEPELVEVKSGAGGFPQSARETLVAFANSEGGTLLIGVDELSGYTVVELDDAGGYRDRLVGLARDAITPPLSITTEIVEVEGALVIAAHVPPLSADQKPAYVTSKGVVGGSYVRSGDGDRPVSQTELALIVANRTQPLYDREPITGTTTDDLDRASLLRSLERVRSSSRRLRDLDEVELLYRVNILAEPRAGAPLTLAGLLTFGQLPQQYFPQLMVTVVVHPAEPTGGTRFLDNAAVRGPIPDLVVQSLAVVRRNIAARAQMGDLGRRDILEIPTEAVREAIVNAVMHRDYSPATRGTQVTVDLFADRLEIRSPGGLYGLSADDLGEVGATSSRNAVLANLLADTYLPGSDELVAENRASGIPTMMRQAQTHGLPLPKFRSTVTGFTVTMARSELLNPDVRRWIHALRADLPTPTHEVALAMLRGGPVTNEMLRRWGADRITAGRVLRDLVDQGLAVMEGGRRWARYVLDPARADAGSRAVANRDERSTGAGARPRTEPTSLESVAEMARGLGSFTAWDVEGLTDLSRPTVVKALKALIEQGDVAADGAPNSPKRRYRWVGPASREEPSASA